MFNMLIHQGKAKQNCFEMSSYPKQIKKTKTTNARDKWRKRGPYPYFWRSSKWYNYYVYQYRGFTHKSNRSIIWPSYIRLRHIPKDSLSYCKDTCSSAFIHGHCCSIHNNPEMEKPRSLSTEWWMDNENVVHVHNVIFQL